MNRERFLSFTANRIAQSVYRCKSRPDYRVARWPRRRVRMRMCRGRGFRGLQGLAEFPEILEFAMLLQPGKQLALFFLYVLLDGLA